MIGREDELAALSSFLDAVAAHPAALVIGGEAGDEESPPSGAAVSRLHGSG